jgi:hypothetical protein
MFHLSAICNARIIVHCKISHPDVHDSPRPKVLCHTCLVSFLLCESQSQPVFRQKLQAGSSLPSCYNNTIMTKLWQKSKVLWYAFVKICWWLNIESRRSQVGTSLGCLLKPNMLAILQDDVVKNQNCDRYDRNPIPNLLLRPIGVNPTPVPSSLHVKCSAHTWWCRMKQRNRLLVVESSALF